MRNEETGYALIIAWKAVKAVILTVAGVAALLSLRGQVTPLVERLASATHLAPDLLADRLSRRNLTWGGVGLLGVGAFNVVEALSLYYRKRWGPWLVLIATASLVPFEIYRIIERPGVVRIATLAVNLLIVWYLARRVRPRPAVTSRPRPGYP